MNRRELARNFDQSLLALDFVQQQKIGLGPDFQVFTGPMKAFNLEAAPDVPLVRMRGSSTIFDLQDDCMLISALQDMQNAEPGMILWLNHSYEVPNDVFGKLHDAPTIEIQQSLADLWLTGEVVMSNPAAEKTYKMIVQDKVRFGCSIGCIVLEWSFANPDDEWGSPILIHHVQPLEWSVVGIPANQRSWVENSIRGLFGRSLTEGKAEEALRLASAYKGLFPREYPSVVEHVTSAGLRKDLSRVAMRSTHPHQVLYDNNKEQFLLNNSWSGIRPLTRKETTSLFQGAGNVAALLKQSANADLSTLDEDLEPETERGWEVDQKAVCGKTSWPLADINTEWTGSKAEDQIFTWASDDEGEIQAGKAKQGFLYFDPDNTDKKGGYKMPFCYSGDSGLKIVPLGVRACAGALVDGGRTVSASDADKAGMRAKCKTMYGRINSQFSPDPKWIVPWEQEKSIELEEEDEEAMNKKKKEVADSESAAPLNRQDLGEKSETEIKAAADVSVGEDGTHEACTGTHTHAHTAKGEQGSDDNHSHSHSHDGDSSHDHTHAEKSVETPVTITLDAATETSIVVSEPPVLLDNSIDESVLPASNSTEDTLVDLLNEVDAPVLQAKLSIYNDLGKSIGLPEVDWKTLQDYLTQEAAGTALAASLLPEQKAGRTISAKTGTVIQKVHDLCLSLVPGACEATKGQPAQDDDGDEDDDDDGKDDDDDNQKSVTTQTLKATEETLMLRGFTTQQFQSVIEEKIADAIKGLNLPAVFQTLFNSYREPLETLHSEQSKLEKQIEKTKGEQLALSDQIARLARMPLGRPTNLTRSIVADPASHTATYPDMLSASSNAGPIITESLADLEAYTRIVEKQVPQIGGSVSLVKYRHWPAGVGGSVGASATGRPALTQGQKTMMLMHEWDAYNSGQEAMVPMIDDPFEC